MGRAVHFCARQNGITEADGLSTSTLYTGERRCALISARVNARLVGWIVVKICSQTLNIVSTIAGEAVGGAEVCITWQHLQDARAQCSIAPPSRTVTRL